MWEKIKLLFVKYSPIALPVKLMVGAFIGVIAGPGLLGFVSELATYRYAAAQGIRPPLEGIPYLRASVTYGSFSLLIVGAGLFVISLYIAGNIASNVMRLFEHLRSISPNATESVLQRFRSLKLKYVAALSAVVAAVFALFSFGIRYIAGGENDLVPATLFFGTYGSVATLLVWRRELAWWLASFVTVCGFILAISVMFNIQRYGEFLRFVGYGGGIAITVQTDHSKDGAVTFNGSLILRTTDALIVFDPSHNEIVELPMRNIRTIKHAAEPLLSLPAKLP